MNQASTKRGGRHAYRRGTPPHRALVACVIGLLGTSPTLLADGPVGGLDVEDAAKRCSATTTGNVEGGECDGECAAAHHAVAGIVVSHLLRASGRRPALRERSLADGIAACRANGEVRCERGAALREVEPVLGACDGTRECDLSDDRSRALGRLLAGPLEALPVGDGAGPLHAERLAACIVAALARDRAGSATTSGEDGGEDGGKASAAAIAAYFAPPTPESRAEPAKASGFVEARCLPGRPVDRTRTAGESSGVRLVDLGAFGAYVRRRMAEISHATGFRPVPTDPSPVTAVAAAAGRYVSPPRIGADAGRRRAELEEFTVIYRRWRSGSADEERSAEIPRIDCKPDGDGAEHFVAKGAWQVHRFTSDGVIDGWRDALRWMEPGRLYRLEVPSGKAYGEHGVENVVAPFETLLHEIVLHDVH